MWILNKKTILLNKVKKMYYLLECGTVEVYKRLSENSSVKH